MNKQERKIKGIQRFKRLQKILGISDHNYKYRTTGKPCSCFLCSPGKYKQNGLTKKAVEDLKRSIEG